MLESRALCGLGRESSHEHDDHAIDYSHSCDELGRSQHPCRSLISVESLYL